MPSGVSAETRHAIASGVSAETPCHAAMKAPLWALARRGSASDRYVQCCVGSRPLHRLPGPWDNTGLVFVARSASRHDDQMDDGRAEHRLAVQVKEVQPGTADFEVVLALAARILAQDRYRR
jgi:hypothetical protein